ncbi:MAG: hypothetical protein EZS28_015482, partial [Streblomastix strix]
LYEIKDDVIKVKLKLKIVTVLMTTNDKCSKEVHIVMSNAGIDKKFSVTTIRKVEISAMQNKDKTKIEIDRWSRHSESTDIVRENYDVNSNDSIRKALSECVSATEEGEVSEL